MGQIATVFYLVGVLIEGGEPKLLGISQHDTIIECFAARDTVLVQNELYEAKDLTKYGVQFYCLGKDEEFI